MKQHYLIIIKPSEEDLQQEVNKLIDEGYTPIGGVSHFFSRTGLGTMEINFVQAVTKLLQNKACETL